MTKTYKSNILAAVHENMQNAYDIGAIDKKTMRRFDESCLTEVLPLLPEDIIKLRKREGISQAVMARYLNVAVKLVGEWERGEKKPSNPSLKLLSLINNKGIDAIA